MDMRALIAKKRDGQAHTQEELRFIANGAARGEIPDYQLSAWLMAAYLNPLSEQETAWLTLAMADSGERIDLTGLPKPWVDKHSTGGVGDKTTIVLLPLLAACGLTVVKMSGRGLGITGGTVDKLASIPGFRTDLTPEEMKEQAKRIGIAWTGQSPDLAPADKALYALRDATATVDSVPLIISSILSKKIAGGAERIVLDIKCGSGAFMRSPRHALTMKQWMQVVGAKAGLILQCAISDMEQPLGSAVGNAIEVKEAIRVLKNETLTPPEARFRELCIRLASLTLLIADSASTDSEARAQVVGALESGEAESKARQWFEAQGADPRILDNPDLYLPKSVHQASVAAPARGWVERVDAGKVGEVALMLGAGRKRKEDRIDPAVGVEVFVMVGDKVEKGQSVFLIHARSHAAMDEARELLRQALAISQREAPARHLFLGDGDMPSFQHGGLDLRHYPPGAEPDPESV